MEEISYTKEPIDWTPNDNQKYQSSSNETYRYNNQKKQFTPPQPVMTIYTDGGARILNVNGQKKYLGSWAFMDKQNGEIYGKAEDNVTNNQMEMTALIKALEYADGRNVPKDKWISIYMDSEYVRKGTLFWVKKWAKNNWQRINQEGKVEEIKNLDLWKKIYQLTSDRKVYIGHVAGHSGVPENEKVDERCTELINEYMQKIGL